jgi:hypothetical protein
MVMYFVLQVQPNCWFIYSIMCQDVAPCLLTLMQEMKFPVNISDHH